MSDIIYYKNGEETFRISPPTLGTKCPETKLEIKMTETDISKVLIEGEYATIMGVKYKRVEMTDKQKLEFLLTELKSTAKRKTCYDSLGSTGHYHYSDDHDATFDDGDRYGKTTFARELLDRMGESYD
jgi:hypothetical protein